MGDKINVLVYPCGSENGLEIHSSLKDVYNINLFGASGKEDHGAYLYKNYFGGVPYITDNSFVDTFNSLLTVNSIDIVFPTHDDIALFLAKKQNVLKSRIAVPGITQAEICRSKISVFELFENESFTPLRIVKLNNDTEFPLFAKPDEGQGGKDTILIKNEEMFRKITEYGDYVITEYLPGQEMTVDCFTDRSGKIRFIGPRKRNRIFGGISVNSSTEPLTKEIEDIALRINEKLKMRGLWFFQVKQDKFSKYKLMEISVRTAGTMNLYRGLGVNFPLLTVYDLMNHDIEIINNNYDLVVDRALFNRYKSTLEFEAIYIDFDDTIVKNNMVNFNVMLFLYNMKNAGKKIFMITKHAEDIDTALDKYSIHPGLFDRIIRLQLEDDKYKHINPASGCIFIDNAYKERLQVKKEHKIPVFDVDAIVTLIDWRE